MNCLWNTGVCWVPLVSPYLLFQAAVLGAISGCFIAVPFLLLWGTSGGQLVGPPGFLDRMDLGNQTEPLRIASTRAHPPLSHSLSKTWDDSAGQTGHARP